MKIKKIKKKLHLKKQTISNLLNLEMKNLRGGAEYSLPRFCANTYHFDCTLPCPTLLRTWEPLCTNYPGICDISDYCQ